MHRILAFIATLIVAGGILSAQQPPCADDEEKGSNCDASALSLNLSEAAVPPSLSGAVFVASPSASLSASFKAGWLAFDVT